MNCEVIGTVEQTIYVWYCCNGEKVIAFGTFISMMDFLISDEGNGWWPL